MKSNDMELIEAIFRRRPGRVYDVHVGSFLGFGRSVGRKTNRTI